MEITTVAGYMAEGAIRRVITTSGTITLNVPCVGELVTLDGMSEKAYQVLNVTIYQEKDGIDGFADLIWVNHEDEELPDMGEEIQKNVRFARFELSDLV